MTTEDEYKEKWEALRSALKYAEDDYAKFYASVERHALDAIYSGQENAFDTFPTEGDRAPKFWEVAYGSICYTGAFEEEGVSDLLESLGYRW